MGATGGYDNDVFLDTSVDSFVTVSTGDTLTASNHSRHRWVKLYPLNLQTEVVPHLDWESSCGWLECWEGLLYASNVLITSAGAIFRVHLTLKMASMQVVEASVTKNTKYKRYSLPVPLGKTHCWQCDDILMYFHFQSCFFGRTGGWRAYIKATERRSEFNL